MLGRTYPADAVERASHLMGHHRGAGQNGIDHIMTDQLGDQRGDPFMDIGAASVNNRHPAPFFLAAAIRSAAALRCARLVSGSVASHP
jgi:hypothetical protein